MSDYRLYFLAGGHIVAVDEFESATDEDAVTAAQAKADGRDMELWRGATLVRKLPAAPH